MTCETEMKDDARRHRPGVNLKTCDLLYSGRTQMFRKRIRLP